MQLQVKQSRSGQNGPCSTRSMTRSRAWNESAVSTRSKRQKVTHVASRGQSEADEIVMDPAFSTLLGSYHTPVGICRTASARGHLTESSGESSGFSAKMAEHVMTPIAIPKNELKNEEFIVNASL
ncbi:uncharacterized protein N7483_010669 [Penicillium malachiteum]|uniref:uncharacterized protein n=1 Tax=Penicillium malachiteum TaxID=1324776 RepID=UPI002546F118|nr:uncharacterized protein N7483_010669 [Penicillium malachiteum]KAJ5713488.1 hypothetical protein N7483_010669 [Penicillium malachiteum]